MSNKSHEQHLEEMRSEYDFSGGIRGKHYEMEKAIRLYPKFVGGVDADAVANYFLRAGLQVVICRSARTTELAKLMSTTYLGVLIQFARDFERDCQRNNVPFNEAYTLFLQTFNDATTKHSLGDPVFPIMAPIQRPIGGHCVLQNCDLWETRFTRLVKAMDEPVLYNEIV